MIKLQLIPWLLELSRQGQRLLPRTQRKLGKAGLQGDAAVHPHQARGKPLSQLLMQAVVPREVLQKCQLSVRDTHKGKEIGD